jgi:6-pyruvoyltetrahydropterin/6-carboxytetrahydropterin synthase
MLSVTVRVRFNASHSVQIGAAPPETPHGHDWLVEVEIAAAELDRHGLVVDFRRVERLLDECLADFHGALLNELPAFAEADPTTERIAETIHRRLDEKLRGAHGRLARTTVWETDACGATYRPA